MTRIAHKLALKADRKQRHSALVLHHNTLLASANNAKGHAEQMALRIPKGMPDDYFKGCTLISYRVKPSGSIGNSTPCSKCWAAIQAHGIRRVIYFDGTIWVEQYV